MKFTISEWDFYNRPIAQIPEFHKILHHVLLLHDSMEISFREDRVTYAVVPSATLDLQLTGKPHIAFSIERLSSSPGILLPIVLSVTSLIIPHRSIAFVGNSLDTPASSIISNLFTHLLTRQPISLNVSAHTNDRLSRYYFEYMQTLLPKAFSQKNWDYEYFLFNTYACMTTYENAVIESGLADLRATAYEFDVLHSRVEFEQLCLVREHVMELM